VNRPGIVEAVESFGERVVVTVTDAAENCESFDSKLRDEFSMAKSFIRSRRRTS